MHTLKMKSGSGYDCKAVKPFVVPDSGAKTTRLDYPSMRE